MTGPATVLAALLASGSVLGLRGDIAPGPATAGASIQDRCEHRAERSARVGAAASDRLALRAGSGSLRIEGVRGLEEVRVRAVACASSAEWLDALRVTAGRSGEEIRVETRYPDDDRGRGDRYARLDLVVEVPMDPEGGAWMVADIHDTSGGMEVSGLGDTRIDDNSGEIVATNINGFLRIDDNSGEIHARDVAGDVEIDDGSGEILLQDVAGNVTLEDGSGSIDVRDVGGSVVVRDDGSGDIRVSEVAGDFRVHDDGSGGISVRDVRGRVEIPPQR